MARADLPKQLFRAYRESDRESFMDVVRTIADEERKKHYPALANELLRILNNGVVAAAPNLRGSFQPPPRDHEKKVPLLEFRHPDRYFRELVLHAGCQPRFPNPLGEDSQRYALVATLEHDSQNIDVYQQVQARVRIGLAG